MDGVGVGSIGGILWSLHPCYSVWVKHLALDSCGVWVKSSDILGLCQTGHEISIPLQFRDLRLISQLND